MTDLPDDGLTSRKFETENARTLRWAMGVHCKLLPGCPGEHHPDCPRYPPRWATTVPGTPQDAA